MKQIYSIILLVFLWKFSAAQEVDLSSYNVIWNGQSNNSSESMPCGGGDVGLNVWTEKDDVLFYMARSGTFDENNTLLKLGRVRLRLSPNPFHGGAFKQELKLQEGAVYIEAKNEAVSAKIKLWVDVFAPVVHVDIAANKPLQITATYENWRYRDRITKGKENNANAYKWAPPGDVVTKKDIVDYETPNGILFYHQNGDSTVFDVTVKQQGLDGVKKQLFNPLSHLTFGGLMTGEHMKPSGETSGSYLDTDYKGWGLTTEKATKNQSIKIYLYTKQEKSIDIWKEELFRTVEKKDKEAAEKSREWWANFWKRSYVCIKPTNQDTSDLDWQMGRNYQLFRYMLACNAFGEYPTKFNGGLFTFDPSRIDETMSYTPDFRNWGGGTHTAQNQRLVYWPLLKSGDGDLMKPAFDFYQRILRNAELRTQVYWCHRGASFTEQIENFGLPNPAEYGWKRPTDFDKGMEYNAWLEYQWDTVLEFCEMILASHRYHDRNIRQYLPLVESCLQFFDEHYQYLAKKRGRKALDENGHLVLYPGSAAETYKMAYNANSTVAALKIVTEGLLALPDTLLPPSKKIEWREMHSRIPPLNFRTIENHTLLAPAKLWERINNVESPQLYPVFPWGIYGIGKPGLDTARNTYWFDPDARKFRSHVGWKQDNIFAARLGLTDEALQLNRLKLKNAPRRFPTFWGPGFDWVPDHNWGGTGMIGLQEMLLQTVGDKIYVLPAWPMDVDVEFKLHAPDQTSVHVKVAGGKIKKLIVSPQNRMNDIVLPTE
ncbi:DUF5703 domain-containing protein [Olivibacter sp. CPCC 100613]|uniref:DUF5703 domain-containing protein n=1 Tax=Olivibacter sp. CPCC 100613 TaxID=3079931 RepID=UPI002FF7C2EE